MEGGRKAGRPRLRCLEDVENDLQNMRVKIIRQKANIREELTSDVMKANVCRDRQTQGICK
jgi:hypothetical protein